MSNYSYRSCASKSEFSVMFSDSKIAKEFFLVKTKLSYNICCCIAPYCKSMFVDSFKNLPYSLFFDESYNNVLKKGNMDLHVRY